ncbi:uncharacterized protein BKCO1_5000065 [Diplodia corticola]|uniref:Uncharacterized protein n=1 Tax=Diplodia corticola TaxID=236234 RepID=A0A1J9RUT2_9PEZI|nr:uncharacterized protein BKCO1_5000065 [Diplodia corticola]OJD31261.1 hypothetical protein BKCO1_5000065 [Diplodia corticola]
MDPPRLNNRACFHFLRALYNAVSSSIVITDTALLTTTSAKIQELMMDVVTQSNLQIVVPERMPVVQAGGEFDAESIRMHVKGVIRERVELLLHDAATPEDSRVLYFIWNRYLRAFITAQPAAAAAAAAAETVAQAIQPQQPQQPEQPQQPQQPQPTPNLDADADHRHAEVLRPQLHRVWGEEEVSYLTSLFVNDPRLTCAEATPMLNEHYAGRMVDGLTFTERSVNSGYGDED